MQWTVKWSDEPSAGRMDGAPKKSWPIRDDQVQEGPIAMHGRQALSSRRPCDFRHHLMKVERRKQARKDSASCIR